MTIASQRSVLSKPIALVLACLFLPLCLALMALFNASTPRYEAVGGVIEAAPVDEQHSLYMLSGELEEWDGYLEPDDLSSTAGRLSHDIIKTRRMEGKTYRFTLNSEYAEDTWFVLSRPHKSRLWINGIEVQNEEHNSIRTTDSFALADYGQDSFEFVLQVCGSTVYYGYQGITFGTRDRVEGIQTQWIFLDVFAVGLAVMLLILCLSLFSRKKSEKYLLVIVLAVVSLIHFFFSPRHSALRIFGVLQYPATSRVPAVTFQRMILSLDYLALRGFLPDIVKKKDDIAIICTIILGTAAALMFPEMASLTFYISSAVMWAVQYCCIVRAMKSGVREALILLIGISLTLANELHVLLIDLQLIPHGELDVLIMPNQYAVLVYIITLAIATCSRFAGKFNEANILSENLERMVQAQVLEIEEANANVLALQQQKQHFMSGMVHNLRNPLFALGGYMDLLRGEMQNCTPLQSEYLDLMDDKIVYMSKMSKDLLLMTRLEEGVMQFRSVDFELRSLLHSVAEDTMAKGANKHIFVEVNCGDIAMSADELALRQVLDVLLDNSLRYSPDGGVIRICAHTEGTEVVISVDNQGPEIPQSAFASLFDRYKTIATGGSTGLGLSIASALLEQQGGSIRAENKKEGGAAFIFRLPLTSENSSV